MLRAAIAVGILLSVVCGASAQSPVVTIQSTGFQGNTFYIDVALADAGALAGQKLGGIGLGATLSGNGLAHLQTNAPGMRLSGPDWATMLEPQTFAWASFDELSNSGNFGGISGLTTFSMFDLDLTPTVPAPGELLGRFVYAWDGLPLVGGQSITIHISGDMGESQPYLFDQNADPVYAVVDNNDMVIPEPVSTSLLSGGLALLALRRRLRRQAQ